MENPFQSINGNIRRGEPIERLGLTFYPILVKNYEIFTVLKQALAIRQSTLPVKYMSMDYMNALFAMDVDAKKNGKETGGLFFQVLTLFYLSLRIGIKEEEIQKNIFLTEKHGQFAFDHITVFQDGKEADISSLELSTVIRPLIAKQNGVLLPDESENTDLVRSFEAKQAFYEEGKKLNIDLSDMISTVAYLSGVSETEIDEWTVFQFEQRKRAIERVVNYKLYKGAELSGFVQFKNGNPFSSIYFDPVGDELGTKSLEEVGGMLHGAREGKE